MKLYLARLFFPKALISLLNITRPTSTGNPSTQNNTKLLIT